MDEPKFPTREEEDRFYAAIGRAITNWSSLETQLFEIAHLILGGRRDLASIVFYRTPTIETRLTLTSDLVEFVLPDYGPGEHPDSALKTWRRLQGEIRTKLAIRNALAHDPVGSLSDIYESVDGKEIRIEITTASYTSLTAHLRRPGKSPGIIRLRDIETHSDVVTGLMNRLLSFRAMLAE